MNGSEAFDLAPEITSVEPSTFGYGVIVRRHPEIIDAVRRRTPYSPETQDRLDALIQVSSGVVPPVPTDVVDGPLWRTWARPYLGQDWLSVPFLWAESYFYELLLEATGYFAAGPWRGVDPFGPQKDAELASPDLVRDLGNLDALLDASAEDSLSAALRASLWGNRADLGFRLSDPDATSRSQSDDLVVDASSWVWRHLANHTSGTVHVIADNAGRELVADLILIDRLLELRQATSVVLHLKPHPYFVSDATTHDLLASLTHLSSVGSAAGAVANRTSIALRDGRLAIRAHRFWCDPLTFHDLPGDLRGELAAASLVVVKGDLNYRRLVGDRRWAPTMPFASVVEHFPAPVVALRTLKSEVAVGIAPAQLAHLDVTTPRWHTDGTHAVIQARI